MVNGILMKFERYFLEDIFYKIKHWKYLFQIEVYILIFPNTNFYYLFIASVMFAFTDRSIVKKVVNFLPRVGVGGRYGLPQQR